MKRMNIAVLLFFANSIFWITYNSIYGWNLKPVDELETLLDTIYSKVNIVVVILYFSPLIDIYSNWVEKKLKKIKS